ncbi:MAG: hypothetical protein AAF628_26635 [Planctomycetota bacterium]
MQLRPANQRSVKGGRPPAWRAAIVAVGAAVAACAPADDNAAEGADTLVLELGGPHQPLGEALRTVGVQPAAAPAPAEESPAEADAAASRAATLPSVPGPPSVERWAELGEGQTLYHVARDELGDASRWHELLELNGWTEEQARRLQPGTRVRLPDE